MLQLLEPRLTPGRDIWHNAMFCVVQIFLSVDREFLAYRLMVWGTVNGRVGCRWARASFVITEIVELVVI